MSFQVLSNLPIADQREYERISAIPSGQRTAGEQAFLDARSSYAGNTIIERDESENILRASGPQVPDGEAGFAKGAFFIETDTSNGNSAVYQNIGDENSCDFQELGGGGGGAENFIDLGDVPSSYGATGNIVTEILTTDDFSFYLGDNQKSIGIGGDGLPYFVYMDNDSTDLHLVHFLNESGSSITNEIIAHQDDGLDSAVLVMGSDDLPRVAYVAYPNPNEIHYVVVNNADGTDVDDVVVTTGNLYEIALDVDSNDVPYIAYNDYDDDKLKMAVCSDSAGTLDTVTDMVDGADNRELTIALRMGSDDFARIAYFANGINPELHLIVCANAAGTSKTDEVIDDAVADARYYLDMELSGSNLARIVYGDASDGLKYAQCTNTSGSSHTINVLDPTSNGGNGLSLSLGADGFGRVAYISNDGSSLKFAQCLNADGSSVNLGTLAEGRSPVSMIWGLDDFARILFRDVNTSGLAKYARLVTDDGVNITNAGKFIQVNDDNDGLEFDTLSFTQLYAAHTKKWIQQIEPSILPPIPELR